MRIFASDRMRQFMAMGIPEDEAIESGILGRAIESAQRKVEGHHFDIRKHLLEYDDVLNKHRQVFYKKRFEFLTASEQPTHEGERETKKQIREYFLAEIETLVSQHTIEEDLSQWEWQAIEDGWKALFPANADLSVFKSLQEEAASTQDVLMMRTKVIDAGMKIVDDAYANLEASLIDPAIVQDLEKTIVLRLMDDLWILHLETMDHLRHGIGLQGYGQRDPLVEYKKEGYRLFHELLGQIQQRVTHTLFLVHVQPAEIKPTQTEAKVG